MTLTLQMLPKDFGNSLSEKGTELPSVDDYAQLKSENRMGLNDSRGAVLPFDLTSQINSLEERGQQLLRFMECNDTDMNRLRHQLEELLEANQAAGRAHEKVMRSLAVLRGDDQPTKGTPYRDEMNRG